MIIKSMSRKVPSFGQLIGYIDREGMPEQYRIRHHLFGWEPEKIRAEFERNAALLQKRRNGVYLYHEILSITRAAGLDPEEQKARLMEIVREYIAARCPDNLVYGGLHQDKDHSLHFHLMISANRADDAKRLRLDKRQFREIQVRLEEYVLKRYPELEQKLAIGKRSDRKLNQAEVELERRTGERPARQTVLERIQEALAGARDRDSLREALGRSDLELYVRGKNLGVIDHETGKKHRLNTLDPELMPAFEAKLLKIEAEPEEPKREEEAERKAEEARREAGRDSASPERPERDSDKQNYVRYGSNADPKVEPEAKPRQAPKRATEESELSPEQKAWREDIDRQRGQTRETDRDRDSE